MFENSVDLHQKKSLIDIISFGNLYIYLSILLNTTSQFVWIIIKHVHIFLGKSEGFQNVVDIYGTNQRES